MSYFLILSILQVVVFLMGLLSLGLSISYLVYFLRVEKRHIARSMVFLMLEQIMSATGTMIFSANSLWCSLMGCDAALWNTMDPAVAISIRMCMFAAMIHSTVHLTVSIKKVIGPNRDSAP